MGHQPSKIREDAHKLTFDGVKKHDLHNVAFNNFNLYSPTSFTPTPSLLIFYSVLSTTYNYTLTSVYGIITFLAVVLFCM
jgi:hypothetical protein